MTTYYRIENTFDIFEEEDSFEITMTEEQFKKSCKITKTENEWWFQLFIEDSEGNRKVFGDVIEKKELYKYVLLRQLSTEVNVRLFSNEEDDPDYEELDGVDSTFLFEAYV